MATQDTTPGEEHGLEGESQRRLNTRGLWVLAVLAVLTALEFIFAITLDDTLQLALLGISAALKALLIAHYFMHWRQVWEHVRDIARGDAEVVEE